jgi:hypothetical protein
MNITQSFFLINAEHETGDDDAAACEGFGWGLLAKENVRQCLKEFDYAIY